jgi:polysaccharide biosynthesis transport protein
VSVSQILAILLRRVWIFVLTLLSTIITVVAVLHFATARYEAHATASIDPGNMVDPVSGNANGARTIDLMQGNILSLVRSERVAIDVVKRLNVTNNPQMQRDFADRLLTNLAPTFDLSTPGAMVGPGSLVLDIKYQSPDPSEAALIANTFLAATIDAYVATKAAEADQTARWFAPQLDELRKELEEARAALGAFQAKTNVVAPTLGGDRETSQYMAISDELSNARAGLTALQSRLTSGSTDLSNDPQDPDLKSLSSLKQRVTTAEAEIATSKGVLGADNPKIAAQQANLASVRKQIGDATEKMRQHLKVRIETMQAQIASLEADQERAQKSLIDVQAQRDRLSQLQSDVELRATQLSAREKAAEDANLKSKLTFSDMTVLDKASPPVAPAFPKPFVALPVGIGAGLALGLILVLLAEAADRSVRFPVDLEHSGLAPFLGALERARPSRSQISARRSRGSA